MYDQHVERSAGFAGIAFIVVVIVAAALPGIPPLASAPPREVAEYVTAHHAAWLISAWLTLPMIAFFLWFAVQLRAFLRLAPQVDDGLATYMLTAAVTAASVFVVLASLQAAMTYPTVRPADDPIVRALFYAFTEVATLVFLPLAVMVLAASLSGRRHRSLPAALVAFGYLTALLLAVGSLSVFFGDGFFALGAVAPALVGLVPLAIWIAWSSLALIRAPRGQDAT